MAKTRRRKKGKAKDTTVFQTTGMAGEFLVAGKLFKRKIQTSITLANAKGVDLLAFNPNNNITYRVEVKTLRAKNCFPLSLKNVKDDCVYVFVRLNNFEEQEEFFIVPGADIVEDLQKFFGQGINENTKMPAVNYGSLEPYRNNWVVFDNAIPPRSPTSEQ